MPGRTIFDMGLELMRHFSDVTWTTTATDAAPPIVTYQTLADAMRLLQQQPNAAEQAAAMQQAALQNVAWNQQNPQILAAMQNAQLNQQQNLMALRQDQNDSWVHRSKLNAEVLLKQILTEPQYLSLNALGYFDVQAHSSYRLRRNTKTHVTVPDGEVWSACIHLSDASAPDADRIVAEYLLIVNDEAEYLKTANLTRVGGVATAVSRPFGLRTWTSAIFRTVCADEAGNLPVR